MRKAYEFNHNEVTKKDQAGNKIGNKELAKTWTLAQHYDSLKDRLERPTHSESHTEIIH